MLRLIPRSCVFRLRIDSDLGHPVNHQSSAPEKILYSSYNLTPIDTNNEIVPWVNSDLLVLVSKNLEAIGRVPMS